MRVTVVGGGLAGMSAALAAADAGAEVHLLERRRRLGGLTWSFSRHGRWFDNGQHVFLRCCTAYRQFLQRIGAETETILQPRLDIPVLAPGGRRADLTRSWLPAPFHLGAALARYRHLSPSERLRLARPAMALRRLDLDDPRLDEESFATWLQRRGQDARAIERLWELIVLPTVNLPAEQASLALAAMVFRTGLLDSTPGADVGWSAVPLGQLHGANAGRALRQAGVRIRLGAAVEAVDGHRVVTDEGTELETDAVVLAVPPAVAATVVPAGTLGPVLDLGSSPIVNVHLVLDRRVTELPLAAAVGSPVQFVFDRSKSAGIEPASGHQYLAISLSAAGAYIGQRPGALVRTFMEALGELFPAARRARLVDAVVTREHEATFAGRPGTAALRPGPVTPVDGLYVAGAWCATGWPATMEGAVRSGTAATLRALGRSPATGLDGAGTKRLRAVA